MNILYICTKSPWEMHDGENLRSFYFLLGLTEKHSITLICPQSDIEIDEYKHQLSRTKFREVIRTKRITSSFTLVLRAVTKLEPFFYSRLFDSFVAKRLATGAMGNFDLVFLDGLVAYRYYNSVCHLSTRSVLDIRDAWSLLYCRLPAKNIFSKITHRLKHALIKNIERKILKTVDSVVVITENDQNYLRETYNAITAKLTVVQNGVHSKKFCSAIKSLKSNVTNVTFSGAMDYFPNHQAAIFFIDNVMPAIRKIGLDCTFVIVGRNPMPELLERKSLDIQITGTVEDVTEYLKNSDIIVAPLLAGAGLKNKVLEGMATGRPVIASSIALEGIGATHLVNVIEANSVYEWVAAIAKLKNEPLFALELGETGQKFCKKNFQWENSIKMIQNIIECN